MHAYEYPRGHLRSQACDLDPTRTYQLEHTFDTSGRICGGSESIRNSIIEKSNTIKNCPSAIADSRSNHEAVVSVFGDLPPQILIRTIGLHRIDRLFEVSVLC